MTHTCAKTFGGIETNICITAQSCLMDVLAFSRTPKIHHHYESTKGTSVIKVELLNTTRNIKVI